MGTVSSWEIIFGTTIAGLYAMKFDQSNLGLARGADLVLGEGLVRRGCCV